MYSKRIFLGTCNLRRKIIKKAIQILSVFVLIVVGIVVLVWSTLRSPLIQTMLANQITSVLSRTLNAEVKVTKARYYIRQGLTLQDVLIKCPNGDTLLFVPQLSGYLRMVNINEQQIGIQRAYIRGVKANIERTDSVFNFSFLADAFSSSDTVKSPWKVDIDEITLVQTNVLFNDNGKSHNFNDISVDISDFTFKGDSLSARLETFCTGYNGVAEIGNLEMDFSLYNGNIGIKNLILDSRRSNVTISKAEVRTGQQLFYNVDITNLLLNPSDYAMFVPKFEGNNERVALKGNVSGTLNSLKGKQMRFVFGDSSTMNFDIKLDELCCRDSLSYDFNVSRLETSSADIVKMLGAYTATDTLALKKRIGMLGKIDFNGRVGGTFSNVEADGALRTGIGDVNLQANIDKADGQAYDVSGWLKSTPVELGWLTGTPTVLRVDMQANGRVGNADETTMNVKGVVNSIEYAGHTIDSITIDGRFADKVFNGYVCSFDPNLRLDFDGLVNVGDIQTYNFKSCVYYANLAALGLSPDSTANISFNLNADFHGPNIDLAEGSIDITDIFYFYDSAYFATDTILIFADNTDEGKSVSLQSEFVSATAGGRFKLTELPRSIGRFTQSFASGREAGPASTDNDIWLEMIIDYPHPLTQIFAPWLNIASGSRVKATLNDNTSSFGLNIESDNIVAKSFEIEELAVDVHNEFDKLLTDISAGCVYFASYESMKGLHGTMEMEKGNASLNLNWNNLLDRGNNSGNISAIVSMADSTGKRTRIELSPSWITIIDTTALIEPAVVTMLDTAVVIEHLSIDNGTSSIFADGVLSDYPDDSLLVDVDNLKLDFVSDVFGLKTRFDGTLSALSNLKDLKGEKRIDGNLSITDFAIGGQRFGDIKASAEWDMKARRLNVGGSLADNGGQSETTFGGYIDPRAFYMNIDAEATHQDAQFLKLFLSGVFSNIEGAFSGKMHLDGKLTAPDWEGKLGLEDARLTLASTKATYIVNDTLEFDENRIVFNNVVGHDAETGTARLNGTIWHRDFSDFNLDLKINCNNIIALNTRAIDSPLWYGKTYASGIVNITGSNRHTIDIDISATTMPKSMFYITMEGRNDLSENDFITFVSAKNVKNINEVRKSRLEPVITAPRSIVNLNLDLNVTPEAEVQIVFDPTIGDALRANGTAQLNIRLDDGTFSIYGTYLINKGNFTFTLQNVISKKLDLQSGSYVTWTGDPLGAIISIDAAYKLRKVPVYSLTLNEEDREKRVPVNCHLLMSNKLVSPNISFSIDVPSTITRIEEIEQLNSLPEDDLNQQVINLLLLNKFYPLTSVSENSTGTTAANTAASTASELLSNQLSKWISQVSTAFDLGVAYRPETEISSEEYELALSTSLWDDRITVSSSFDVNNQNTNTEESNTQYTTDFTVELKLNKKGNVRLKAFQKVNDDLIYDDSPYTRGFGIFYTEDFNDLGELWHRWLRRRKNTSSSNYDSLE